MSPLSSLVPEPVADPVDLGAHHIARLQELARGALDDAVEPGLGDIEDALEIADLDQSGLIGGHAAHAAISAPAPLRRGSS